MSIRREKIKVYDMTCTSCENRVEKAVKKVYQRKVKTSLKLWNQLFFII